MTDTYLCPTCGEYAFNTRCDSCRNEELEAILEATVTLTYGQLASIASLSTFASPGKDGVTIITGIHVTLDQGVNGGYLSAVSTDRYRVGEISFPIDYTGDKVSATIPAKVLTDFAKANKPAARSNDVRMPIVELTISESSFTIKHLITWATTTNATVKGMFPPVYKLWPTESQPVAGFSINPAFFADLAKVVNPLGEQLKNDWHLSFTTKADDKAGPIIAAHFGTDGATLVRVLIQPRLDRR